MNTDDASLDNVRLHNAAQSGDFDDVKLLISAGYDVNAFDEIGKTPLHYAASGGHLAIARHLLESGANVNARHEQSVGNTPLGDIAGDCAFNMAEMLIDAGADPGFPGWMQITALQKASRRARGDGPRVYALLLRASLKCPRR